MKRLVIYLIVLIPLFGMFHLCSEPSLDWNKLKYQQSKTYTCSREELEAMLRNYIGKDEKLLNEKLQLPTPELRDYIYDKSKDSYPEEYIAKDAEENSSLGEIKKVGKLGIIAITILVALNLFKRTTIGDRFRIVRALKRFDTGFKIPSKDK